MAPKETDPASGGRAELDWNWLRELEGAGDGDGMLGEEQAKRLMPTLEEWKADEEEDKDKIRSGIWSSMLLTTS